MRTVISSSSFGFVVFAVFVSGCSLSTETEASSASEGVTGIAEPRPGSMADVPVAPGAATPAEPNLGPTVPAGELTDVELTHPMGGFPAAPSATGFAELEPGPMANVPVAVGCTSDAECGSNACYQGMHEAFSCDDTGTCQVAITSCGFYGCGETGCATFCTSDADCDASGRCDGSRCVAK